MALPGFPITGMQGIVGGGHKAYRMGGAARRGRRTVKQKRLKVTGGECWGQRRSATKKVIPDLQKEVE